MPQPVRVATDADGTLWLVLDNGHRIRLLKASDDNGSAAITDHGDLTGLEANDHPQYVLDTGDTMTGPLILDTGVQDPDSPLTIVNTDYPSIKFFKRSAPANLRQWRQYISGHLGGVTLPDHHAMSWMPENDDGTDPPNDPAFRMTRDGRFRLPSNGAVEFRAGSDVRSIGMDVTSESGTVGLRVLLDREANTLGSIGVASPYLPEHAAPRSYVDTYQESGLMVSASGWADYGSSYGGLLCIKSGGMITLEGLFKRTAGDVAVGSSTVLVGTVPVGFRSSHDITIPVQAWTSGGYPSIRGIIYGTGELRVQAMPQVTIATGGWVSFVATYRGA